MVLATLCNTKTNVIYMDQSYYLINDDDTMVVAVQAPVH